MRPLLLFCLDAADLSTFQAHAGPQRWPALAQELRYAKPLRSTIIPQTPVAWTSLLTGAPPEHTGVWGWCGVRDGRVVPVDPRALPATWCRWDVTTLFAGIPLTPDDADSWGRSLRGLGGPRPMRGGSRPDIHGDIDADDAERAWRIHHDLWLRRIREYAHGHPLVLVHCDSVDWFSHRWGPRHPNAARGWVLADALLATLLDTLRPAATVVVSDHGATEVTRVVRIHEALYRAGLARRPPEALGGIDDVLDDPVYCISDYGALWCRDDLIEPAERLLTALGAHRVHLIDSTGSAPKLVPEFEDGCLVLTPPALYAELGEGEVVAADAVRDVLARHHWAGDHARHGLVGTGDATLWRELRPASLVELKWVLTRAARSYQQA